MTFSSSRLSLIFSCPSRLRNCQLQTVFRSERVSTSTCQSSSILSRPVGSKNSGGDAKATRQNSSILSRSKVPENDPYTATSELYNLRITSKSGRLGEREGWLRS